MSGLVGGETAADFVCQMKPILDELLQVASNYTFDEDRTVLSARLDTDGGIGYLIAVRGTEGPLPTLAAHLHAEIQKVYRQGREPTPPYGHPSQEGMAEREALLQMMAISIQVAAGVVARQELKDQVTDLKVLREATFDSYCTLLSNIPEVMQNISPQDRRDFLETTLKHLAVEQQRFGLEQQFTGGQADA